jgi:hypothetical protein
MKKTFRVAVLSTVLALCAAPVFADPGGGDPPPPKGGSNGNMGLVVNSILGAILGIAG